MILTAEQKAFREWAGKLAKGASSPSSHLYWLRDPSGGSYQGGCLPWHDNGGDFCEDCILNAPTLVPLTICLLLDLLGLNGSGPREHVMLSARGYCVRCSGHGGKCCSAAEEVLSAARDCQDGGWGWESDSHRFCAGCGNELIVHLTDHAAGEELLHFSAYPPRTVKDYLDVCEAFDAGDDEVKAGFLALAPAWGFAGPLTPRSNRR